MSFSIFIASRTRTVSPFFTAWPAAAFTATIFPGIGAVTLTEPAAPAGAAGAGAGAAAGAGAGAGTGAAGAGAAAKAAGAAAFNGYCICFSIYCNGICLHDLFPP